MVNKIGNLSLWTLILKIKAIAVLLKKNSNFF